MIFPTQFPYSREALKELGHTLSYLEDMVKMCELIRADNEILIEKNNKLKEDVDYLRTRLTQKLEKTPADELLRAVEQENWNKCPDCLCNEGWCGTVVIDDIQVFKYVPIED